MKNQAKKEEENSVRPSQPTGIDLPCTTESPVCKGVVRGLQYQAII